MDIPTRLHTSSDSAHVLQNRQVAGWFENASPGAELSSPSPLPLRKNVDRRLNIDSVVLRTRSRSGEVDGFKGISISKKEKG